MGISTRTSNAQEVRGNGSIPKLWQRFFQEGVMEHIPHSLPNSPAFGLYTEYEDGVRGLYTVIIGLQLAQPAVVPEGLVTASIPAGKYAVFTTARGPISEIVPKCWAAIWDCFPHTEMERAFTGDFERYDERAMNPEDAVADIYIAIK